MGAGGADRGNTAIRMYKKKYIFNKRRKLKGKKEGREGKRDEERKKVKERRKDKKRKKGRRKVGQSSVSRTINSVFHLFVR